MCRASRRKSDTGPVFMSVAIWFATEPVIDRLDAAGQTRSAVTTSGHGLFDQMTRDRRLRPQCELPGTQFREHGGVYAHLERDGRPIFLAAKAITDSR